MLVVAFVALRPEEQRRALGETATATSVATTPASTSTGTQETTPVGPVVASGRPAPPLLRAGTLRTITVVKGDTVHLRARSATHQELHVHGYDLKRDLPAGRTVGLAFAATIEGIFAVELEGTGEQIARLVVEP